MSLSLSPSMLRKMLLQSTIGKDLRRSLAEAFAFGSPAWSLLEQVGKKKACLPTRDPVLLALRRLAWPEQLGELHAMHRVAAEEAAKRPHGFLHLVLEEAAALERPGDPPEVQGDEAFKIFFPLARENGKLPHQEELKELRARAFVHTTRRLITLGDPCYGLFLPYAYLCVGDPCPNLELNLFLRETMARALERDGKPEEAVNLLLEAVLKLAQNTTLAERLIDRWAEGLVEVADMMCRHKLSPAEAESCYSHAGILLRCMPQNLNLPLRRRLAARPSAKVFSAPSLSPT